MKSFLRNYALPLILFAQYAISHGLHGYTLYHHLEHEAQQHGQELTTSEFLWAFGNTTFENWQSESWQSFWLVLLPIWFIAKGSPQSKDSEERLERKVDALHRLILVAIANQHRAAQGHTVQPPPPPESRDG